MLIDLIRFISVWHVSIRGNMALYKLDETGEAVRVDYEHFREWCEGVDVATLVLARHDIIEHKQLGALAVDAIKGKYHRGKVLATVETKLRTSCGETAGPWETGVVGDDPDFRTSSRAQAALAHQTLVSSTVKRFGGRVLR